MAIRAEEAGAVVAEELKLSATTSLMMVVYTARHWRSTSKRQSYSKA